MLRAAAISALLAISSAHAGDKTNDAIAAAVFDYFDGQGERSAERLNRAFSAEHARMIGVLKDDGETVVRTWEMEDTIANWSKGDPITDERTGKIVSMNVVDDRLAVVLFDSNGRFLDALTLAKVGEDWKIMSKVFIVQE
ncbi:hypothetical protein HK107_04205 [Parvularcula sp. ZS-1/3]|uniref:Nuclear transport factor 2 family protein n=1 Tax=Parvularcula mediterranea TaxID=2732508 RepID=A0A7Y3RK84_9PROT|nr:nuclear transport factor 2 family protein [Parvularcula mediterranea]NNU15520.1 hypothetical protein [Parvularcula mediterranea]